MFSNPLSQEDTINIIVEGIIQRYKLRVKMNAAPSAETLFL